MAKHLEVGKRYEWWEVVETYPGKWVLMTDCKFDLSGLRHGILAGVYSDEEVDSLQLRNSPIRRGEVLYRTTKSKEVECFSLTQSALSQDEIVRKIMSTGSIHAAILHN